VTVKKRATGFMAFLGFDEDCISTDCYGKRFDHRKCIRHGTQEQLIPHFLRRFRQPAGTVGGDSSPTGTVTSVCARRTHSTESQSSKTMETKRKRDRSGIASRPHQDAPARSGAAVIGTS
jgi:hypothetical protein